MRLPPGHTRETPTAKGVLAFCPWTQRDFTLKRALSDDKNPLVAYAMKNNLAVVMWIPGQLWETGKSHDDISYSDYRAQDKSFDLVAKAWQKGLIHMCRDLKVPSTTGGSTRSR